MSTVEPGDQNCKPDGEHPTVRLEFGSESDELTRAEAVRLRERLAVALTYDREFTHTRGRYRGDGRYVVERRRSDSNGHRKVFETFDACRRCFEALPRTFSATDLERADVTGSRRHILVWHFCEHPGFSCSLVSKQPLTGRKSPVTDETESTRSTEGT